MPTATPRVAIPRATPVATDEPTASIEEGAGAVPGAAVPMAGTYEEDERGVPRGARGEDRAEGVGSAAACRLLPRGACLEAGAPVAGSLVTTTLRVWTCALCAKSSRDDAPK